ncbi:MAG: ABC transporter permease, partial [Firmicutes bacterium]|nr:ABC transporter permease [Bacillota bacterium]
EMVIPRLKFGAMVSTEEELVAISGWGVNPDQEVIFTNIEDYLVEGRMVEPGKQEVVMGSALLAKLDRRVGETVTILMNTTFGSLRGVTFKIVGRLESGLKVLNEHLFYLPLDQAQRILEMEGQATEVLLVTPKRNLVNKVLPEVKGLIAERGAAERYLALSYKEASDIMAFLEMANIIYNEVYIFLVLLGCIVVIMTMIMVVKERTKEIGMMMALGLESKDILQLFVIEGAIMGSIGSLLGALSGSLFTGYLAERGIDFSKAVSAFDAAHLINPIIYPVSSPGNALFAFVLGTIIVTIACLIPARRAARLEPTAAMREE